MQGVVGVRPDFGEVERIPAIGFGLFFGHDLHGEGPFGEVSFFEGLKELLGVVVGVAAGDAVGFVLHEALDALLCLEVELDPKAFVFGVDEAVGVAAVAVHVGNSLGNAAV